MSNEEINILKTAVCPSLSGRSMLTYNIGIKGDAMHLLQHIRDEAHRFAITGHRQRRQKQRRHSELDDIDGVGPKRRRELLTHFGGIAAIRGASREELAKVPGISQKLADDIYAALHD